MTVCRKSSEKSQASSNSWIWSKDKVGRKHEERRSRRVYLVVLLNWKGKMMSLAWHIWQLKPRCVHRSQLKMWVEAYCINGIR